MLWLSGNCSLRLGASNDHVEGVRCGSNLEMPGNSGTTAKELGKGSESGKTG